MVPEIEILGRAIPSYGLIGALGILLGLVFAILRCPRFGLDRDDCAYIFVFGAVGAMLGAKILYLIIAIPDIIRDLPLLKTSASIFMEKYVYGGMVYYGGFLGALLGSWFSARQYRRKLESFFPVLIPAMSLAHAVGRIGCFLTGCCYGIETDRWFGIAYTKSHVAPNNVSLIPVQLIESGCELIIFAALLWYTSRKGKRASTLCVYVLLYAPLRFFLEFLRGDVVRGSFGGLATSQWISLAAIVAAIACLIYTRLQEGQESRKL